MTDKNQAQSASSDERVAERRKLALAAVAGLAGLAIGRDAFAQASGAPVAPAAPAMPAAPAAVTTVTTVTTVTPGAPVAPVAPVASGASGAQPAVARKAPMVNGVASKDFAMTFQSTWPESDIFNEFAKDYAGKVQQLSGGRIRIEMLPTATKVKTFEVLKAVSSGELDGGHGVLGYWYAQENALGLWGAGGCWGMDAPLMLAWHRFGGGKELLAEIYKNLGMEVESFLHGPIFTQPMGWFKKGAPSPKDFKGMKYRTSGLAVDMFKEMGSEVIVVPAAGITEAFEKGQIDGAEFANATSDRQLGLQTAAQVCMTQSYHQPAEHFEALINRKRFMELPANLQRALELAASATSQQIVWKTVDRNCKDYQGLKEEGVKFSRAPQALLMEQLKAWDAVAARKGAENPMFAKIYESQKVFASRAVRWYADYFLQPQSAMDRYFPEAKAGAKPAAAAPAAKK